MGGWVGCGGSEEPDAGRPARRGKRLRLASPPFAAAGPHLAVSGGTLALPEAGKVPPRQVEVAVAAVDQATTAQQQGARQMTTFKPIVEDRLRHNQVCSVYRHRGPTRFCHGNDSGLNPV